MVETQQQLHRGEGGLVRGVYKGRSEEQENGDRNANQRYLENVPIPVEGGMNCAVIYMGDEFNVHFIFGVCWN